MAAFETLYRRHKDPLFRYFLRGCGQRDLSGELAHDVWASLIRARAGYEHRAKFTTWLYTLAHHRLVDHFRVHTLPTAPLEEAQDIPDTHAPQPDRAAGNAQLRARLTAVLAQLPLEQREAFLLKEEGGLSLEEIAQAQGVGRETVKSRLRYALAKLRQELSDVWP